MVDEVIGVNEDIEVKSVIDEGGYGKVYKVWCGSF